MKLIFTRQFYDDIEEIKDYIATDSEVNAQEVVNKIWNSIEQIEIFPNSGNLLENRINRKTNCRYALVYSYAIVYEVQGEQILIKTVLHLKRDFSAIDFN